MSLEKHNSTDHRLYVPSFTLDLSSPFCLLFFFYLALNFGLASYHCSQTPNPKGLVLPSSPAGVTLKDVKYLCCPAQAAVPALGLLGKALLPLPPAGARVSASTLSNPMPVVFYLHHLSPQPRDEKFPLTAAHSTRLSGSLSNIY